MADRSTAIVMPVTNVEEGGNVRGSGLADDDNSAEPAILGVKGSALAGLRTVPEANYHIGVA
jgi:hypothetical protein